MIARAVGPDLAQVSAADQAVDVDVDIDMSQSRSRLGEEACRNDLACAGAGRVGMNRQHHPADSTDRLGQPLIRRDSVHTVTPQNLWVLPHEIIPVSYQ